MNRGDPLHGPLAELEALGLRRPPETSVDQLLSMLVQAGVLPPEPVERYLGFYRQARFGGSDLQSSDLETAAAALVAEIRNLGEERAARIRQIGAAQQTVATRRPEPVKAGKPERDNRPRYEKIVKQSARPRWRPSKWIVSALIALLLIWSLGVFYAGIRLQPRLSSAYDRLRARFGFSRPIDQRVGTDERLALLGKKAAENPDALDVWRRLAFFSAENHRYAGAIAAYQHILAREPDNAEALNNIAWLLLTASDPVSRDPVWALALATRAYEIDKAPHIADTLAEAHFQNGNRERAIAIEEEITSRFDELKLAPDERSFYSGQLEKFRQGRVPD